MIVSEWIGYFLLFERMLPSVLSVRDRHLSYGGIMIPAQAKMLIAGVSPDRNKYGIELISKKLEEFTELQVMLIAPDRLITAPAILQDLNLMKIPKDFDSFVSNVDL